MLRWSVAVASLDSKSFVIATDRTPEVPSDELEAPLHDNEQMTRRVRAGHLPPSPN